MAPVPDIVCVGRTPVGLALGRAAGILRLRWPSGRWQLVGDQWRLHVIGRCPPTPMRTLQPPH